uniref:Uncharacterized protein n=1 Tax=Eutreptiella gymnastica TaxID=73025 RepID=A0A7S1NJP8_9EUGL|mmetsp:Transcript_44996/g.80498  ORF Transcript_44996/g.80498 Transcript_44996/m.80498 type:complete len:134 (+) Transcript_44996:95-496(+)
MSDGKGVQPRGMFPDHAAISVGRTMGRRFTRLVRCLRWRDKFIDAWVQIWEEWQGLARTWISTATTEDLKSVSVLRIPLSFVESILDKAPAEVVAAGLLVPVPHAVCGDDTITQPSYVPSPWPSTAPGGHVFS